MMITSCNARSFWLGPPLSGMDLRENTSTPQAFDFKEVTGAETYRFTIEPLSPGEQGPLSFTDDSPKASP